MARSDLCRISPGLVPLVPRPQARYLAGSMNVGLIIGQATGPGRLTAAAAVVAEELGNHAAKVAVVDLHVDPVEICDGRAEADYGPATRSALEAIHAADALVIASPVYRATYPGVLK